MILYRSIALAVTILLSLSACGGGGDTVRSASLLFSSGFEGATALSAPNVFGTGASQDIVGFDSTTGFAWPGNLWGGGIRLQMIVGVPVDATTLGDYMVNRIEAVTGHDGNPTQVLYSEIKQAATSDTQDDLMFQPASEQGDLYVSFWLKFQPDLLQKMTPQNWRTFFSWKTAGDYRVVVQVASWENGCGGVKPNGPMYFKVFADNNANGNLPLEEFWNVDNCSYLVPLDEWFKVEIFWHRSSGADGRVWLAVNGQVIADRYGPNMGVNNASINRIALPTLYSGAPHPIYQWVDKVEIWDGFPPDGNNSP